MSLFIARQPIFNRKNEIYGYELLFRQNNNNYFVEMDDDVATTELLYNTFFIFGLDDLTDGTKAFINVSKGLIESDFLNLLPKDKIVIEVLEREKATQSTMDACARFQSLGYTLALDDFILDEDNLPLLSTANILKVEFSALSLVKQAALIKQYKNKVTFLAEKIETRDDYKKAVDLGYDLFQGYFFSKPVMTKSKDIKTINANLFSIIEELNTAEPSYFKISGMIESDLGLSYKLLRLANSVYIGAKYKVKSIKQALNYLGTHELYQWISLMILKDMQDDDNSELVKQSLIRGKLMHMLALELHGQKLITEFFFTGIFSLIDVILNRSFKEILTGLPLSDNVKKTLLGEKNEMRALLDCISSIERAEWDKLEKYPVMRSINTERFMAHYIDAMKWANSLKI
jgi:c-di-GMP-related signal transduction protein